MTLKNGVRAGVVALALGTGALAGAAPAQAQVAPPSFTFSFGMHGPGPGVYLKFGNKNYFKYCLTNTQILRELRSHGYRNAQIVREMNSTNKVWAVARKGSTWYQLRVDRCTGKVDRIRAINGPDKKGHFSLTFTF
jgi:hypothetical protein